MAPIADVPNVLVVSPTLPVKTVQDLVAYAKAHPNTLNFSSTGCGTAAHLSGVLFNERTGVKTTPVPTGRRCPERPAGRPRAVHVRDDLRR